MTQVDEVSMKQEACGSLVHRQFTENAYELIHDLVKEIGYYDYDTKTIVKVQQE